MIQKSLKKPVKFISIRAKLLIIFTVLFTATFGTLFYLLYNFAVDVAVQRMRKNLEDALLAAAAGVSGEDMIRLYREAQPNREGFSDSLLYRQQMDWFQQVHNVNPDVWPYSFVRGNRPDTRRVGEPVLTNDEVIFLVDLWSDYDPSKSVKFLEPYAASPQMIETLEKGVVVHRPEVPLYDQWGGWITAYAPIRDSQGNIVPGFGIGADLTAEYLGEIKRGIFQRVLITFLGCYAILVILIYILANRVIRCTINLTKVVHDIEDGNYSQDLNEVSQPFIEDEITQLAMVLKAMLEHIKMREFKLKQQASDLHTEIDEKKHAKEVQDMADNNFFKGIAEKSKIIRNRYDED
ncbi:MAG: hypothetical protein ACHWZW_06295 [Spirulina sp.]